MSCGYELVMLARATKRSPETKNVVHWKYDAWCISQEKIPG
jgi:hypothetical protein